MGLVACLGLSLALALFQTAVDPNAAASTWLPIALLFFISDLYDQDP